LYTFKRQACLSPPTYDGAIDFQAFLEWVQNMGENYLMSSSVMISEQSNVVDSILKKKPSWGELPNLSSKS